MQTGTTAGGGRTTGLDVRTTDAEGRTFISDGAPAPGVHREGHVGAALAAYAPVALVAAALGLDDLALVGAAVAAALAMAPDVDRRLPLVRHRGPTHTVWFVLVAAAAGGAFGWSAGAPDGPAATIGLAAFGAAVAGLSVGSHVAADALTPAGVRPFAPLSDRRFAVAATRAANPVANLLCLAIGGGLAVGAFALGRWLAVVGLAPATGALLPAPVAGRVMSGEEGPVGGDDEASLTYADAGVDVDASEAATAALVDAAGDLEADAYAGLLDIGDRYLALATDGVGTKLLVAEAVGDYSTVGVDCVAMNVNDLVAAGVEPVAFVDYLAVEAPDDAVAAQLGEGLRAGAEAAGVALVGGETAVMPEVVTGLDLAGTCAGLAPKDATFDGRAEPGDALVGWPSSGIHSNGLTLARAAATRGHGYDDPLPTDPAVTVGRALLEPTAIYVDLLGPMRAHGVRGAAHVTGGGWTNLERLGPHRYVVEDPFDAQPVFEFIRREGDVAAAEMHRTFNMGTGFVAALPPAPAEALASATDGRVIGRVTEGAGVAIRGLEL